MNQAKSEAKHVEVMTTTPTENRWESSEGQGIELSFTGFLF